MVIQQFFFIILHAGCKGQFCAVLVRMATNVPVPVFRFLAISLDYQEH